jgi:hypothetical protein
MGIETLGCGSPGFAGKVRLSVSASLLGLFLVGRQPIFKFHIPKL